MYDRRFSNGILLVLTVVAGLVLTTGCGWIEGSRGRVLLVGIDGASLRVIEPMIEAGRLPNLAAIAREGVSGKLRSSNPISSPRIWNTISTGLVPEKHGIDDFSRRDEHGNRRLLLSSDRKVHSLWNIASDAGLEVGVVNWWNTYPLEPINGVMVSDHLMAAEIEGRLSIGKVKTAPVEDGRLVHPAAWHERVVEILRQSKRITDIANPFEMAAELPPGPEARRKQLAHRFLEDGLLTQIALTIQKERDPDLMMVFLPGIDRVSHFLWGTIEPPELYPERLRYPPEQRAAGAEALHAYYEYTDALIGVLAEGYGSDDLVMVVSDHGFEAGVGLLNLTGAHASEEAIDGILFARGRDIPVGQKVVSVSVADVTPTILAWLGLPIAKDMDGERAGFLLTAMGEKIATYETKPVERLAVMPSGAENEMLEQLEALGYFEGE